MPCPICGSEEFYVKNPEDEYDCYDFSLKDGEVCFDPSIDPAECPEVGPDTETFCNKCAWHGKVDALDNK